MGDAKLCSIPLSEERLMRYPASEETPHTIFPSLADGSRNYHRGKPVCLCTLAIRVVHPLELLAFSTNGAFQIAMSLPDREVPPVSSNERYEIPAGPCRPHRPAANTISATSYTAADEGEGRSLDVTTPESWAHHGMHKLAAGKARCRELLSRAVLVGKGGRPPECPRSRNAVESAAMQPLAPRAWPIGRPDKETEPATLTPPLSCSGALRGNHPRPPLHVSSSSPTTRASRVTSRIAKNEPGGAEPAALAGGHSGARRKNT